MLTSSGFESEVIDDGAALADDREGLADHGAVGEADRDDRARGHTAPALLLHRLERLLVCREGVRGAERQRGLALERERGRPRRASLAPAWRRPLHRVDPDAADAVDDDGVAGTDVRGVRARRRAPAGRDAAGGERDHVERQARVDLHAGVLAGRRSTARTCPSIIVPAPKSAPWPWSRCVPSNMRFCSRSAPRSQRFWTPSSTSAAPAGRHPGGDEVVARPQVLDAGPDGLDHARALVADHHRRHEVDVAVPQVLVRVAHARERVADEDLVLLRVVQLELDHVERPTLALPCDRRLRPHRSSSVPGPVRAG